MMSAAKPMNLASNAALGRVFQESSFERIASGSRERCYGAEIKQDHGLSAPTSKRKKMLCRTRERFPFHTRRQVLVGLFPQQGGGLSQDRASKTTLQLRLPLRSNCLSKATSKSATVISGHGLALVLPFLCFTILNVKKKS